jgi:hypothetical protein
VQIRIIFQLYDCAEHHFSNGGRFSGYPVSQDWWTKDVGTHGRMSDSESQMPGMVMHSGEKIKKEDKIVDLPGTSNS